MSCGTSAGPYAALVREFELELRHLKQMLALAAEEQRDLVAGDMTRLESISAEKLVQLHSLERYAVRRASFLAEQGFAAGARGLAACALAAGRRGHELTTAWKRVVDALADLRDQNEENSTLLRARLAELGGPSLAVTDLSGLTRD